MATIIRSLIKGYRYINEEVADPRTKDFFLISSPWPVLIIMTSYLYFVQTLGPRLMANRKPFNLDRIMQIYNALQIVSCACLFYTGIIIAFKNNYSWVCQPVDYSNTPEAIEVASMVWYYFLLKILDLADTVFFVLRKKQNQVSFLHVYHHTGMLAGTWAGVKYLAGGQVTFLGLINCFVHVIMYTHYLLTSLKMGRPWWKKYITQMQLMQFIAILLHFSQLLWTENCGFPLWPAAVLIPQNLFMIILFADFYYKTYIKKPKAQIERNGIAKESNGKTKTT
ncbi:elongation of very long chain fatty acids protein AAEL008004 [Orussus abietinus]|uniref:elongation of very long chain fatty acids protein AAEL008004 n=1 Tax=Orussus abietinus TaxID=222816 RepID=UPI0006267487|nr:elongation of very long chain fatty acids protein AAEL008004 [Orussus abietinus]